MARKIGAYICHCGTNIADTVDVTAVTEFARSLDSVLIARDYQFLCSEPGQELIRNDIRELGLNRIVVAACSPRLHEATFRRVCEQGGLNPYLFEMANIREHCSWVHRDRELATEKAKALLRAAVMRSFSYQPLQDREIAVKPSVLVVGGGIAGIQAALDVADSGYKVYLVEREPSIGGHMAQLDKTFPTLDCSACILTPKMSAVAFHPNIELLSYSEVEEVSGYIGNFKVRVKRKARYVDEEKCTGCGLCEQKCPWKTESKFDVGLGKSKAIYTPFPQAVPNVPVIDREHCVYFLKDTCRACELFCEPKAIDFEQVDSFVEVEVGAIIVATGYDIFDPGVISQYGYGRHDNVLTALQFERMCSAAGPTGGRIMLRDGRQPEAVAIVHCVGSRDKNHREYCSRVCCMYALKLSHVIKERTDAEVYQLYLDMRCVGKGFEEFYDRLSNEGVKFIRGKVATVTDRALSEEENGRLIVCVADTLIGSMIRIPVDMVILCPALEPRADAEDVARLFAIARGRDGFFLERHPKLDPIATLTDGIFIAGCCQGPKDIPETVAQATAAAARAAALITVGKVKVEPITATIDEEICSGCELCVKMCPYGAISPPPPKGVAVVNEILCKGCGACAAVCPSGAISLNQFTCRQVLDQIEALAS